MKILNLLGAMVLGCLLAGCDVNAIKDPPLAITFREGVLGQVMQVSNLSAGEGLEVYVYVASAETSSRSGNMVIPANGTVELGTIELGRKLNPGDKGFVHPIRYGKKLFFQMMENGQYRKWFGYNDIPEVDVAAQIRAKKAAEHDAWLQKTMSAVKADGVRLYAAITNANAERATAGRASLWPKPQISMAERAKDKLKDWKTKVAITLGAEEASASVEDIAEKKFGSSKEYFDCLFDVGRLGSDRHSPYVTNMTASAASDSKERGGIMSAAGAEWSVLADHADEMSAGIPVLITANFPCERLRSFWDGNDAANEKVALSSVGALKGEAFVVVYNDGSAKALRAEKATLADIYSGAFNTCTNGYNRQVLYLTPSEVVSAVGLKE